MTLDQGAVDDLAQIKDDIREIKVALKGNGLGSSEGMIAKVKDHGDRLVGLEGRLDRLTNRGIGAAVGIGLGAGGLGAFIVNLIGG